MKFSYTHALSCKILPRGETESTERNFWSISRKVSVGQVEEGSKQGKTYLNRQSAKKHNKFAYETLMNSTKEDCNCLK